MSLTRNETRKALFIGIDKYDNPDARLDSCVNDAEAMCGLLEKHGNDDPNFSSAFHKNVTNKQLRQAIKLILQPSRAPHHALIYYSGHGYSDESGGYLVGRDYKPSDMGVSMNWLIQQFNNSKIPFITLILDCCFADEVGQQKQCEGDHHDRNTKESLSISCLRENVTILSATKRDDVAIAGKRYGAFTRILIKGLEGAAADALGRITAANLFSMADTILTPWEQRPVFKSVVTAMEPLRVCIPAVDKELLRALDSYDFFKERNRKKQLQPQDVCTDPKKENSLLRFARLMAFQRAGLIQCVDGRTVYEAALRGKTCELTPFGHFFLELLDKNRI